MAKYKQMYVVNYTDSNFYISGFDIYAEAYRENFGDGTIEKLKVLNILSSHVDSDIEEMDIYDVDYDYDVIFIVGNIKYAVAFEYDHEIDELPKIDNLIYA